MGQTVEQWPEYVVSQNNMSQTGEVDGIKPSMEGRMVRSERYKYCIYGHGVRREALYDLEADPLEMVNLAGEAECRQTLLQHRARLAEYAERYRDTTAADLLSNDVEPRPFKSR